jgi:ATP-binding cassette subfamily A (ABC1) protein 3
LTEGNAYILENSTSSIDLLKHGKSIGMCPQYNPILNQLTVLENLQMMAHVKGLTREQFENNSKLIIETLDLSEFVHVLARNLSGGNKRKLSCAMTLLVSPRIEFLDEPTTGVDPVSRRSLFTMIKRLQNSSILLTTHRMDEAEQLCDNIAIMINGRIVCYGSPNYLLQ